MVPKDINFKKESFLFKKMERCPDEDLIGEEKLLRNPIIDTALDRIMEDYVPQNKYAIFSLG